MFRFAGRHCRVRWRAQARVLPHLSRSAEHLPPSRNGAHIIPAVEDRPRPEEMRRAMCDYVRTVHQSYLSQAELQPPAVRGRMPLLGTPFTVVAAGVRNLHVVASRERLGAPVGPEVEVADELPGMRWTLRFFDPVVLPALGLIDESTGAAGDLVRRAMRASPCPSPLIVLARSELPGDHARPAVACAR